MSRANLHKCERLSVYGTGGEQFYPDSDGAPRPEISDWYTKTRLVGYLDTRDGELMVYTGDLRHPTSIDQAFAVYEGDPGPSLLSNFGRDVAHCLVEELDWELIEATTPTDNKAFYDVLTNSEGALDLSEYLPHDSTFVEKVLTSESTEPLVVHAGDYEVASEVLRGYANLEPLRIDVYHESTPSLTDDVDLAVSVQPGPYDVRVPEASVEVLDDRRSELDHILEQERADDTVEQIKVHADAGDGASVVTNAVERGLAKHYGDYEVLSAETVAKREREREKLEQEADALAEEVANQESKLTEKDQQIERLRRDAGVSRTANRLRRVLTNPKLLFYVEENPERAAAGWGSQATGNQGSLSSKQQELVAETNRKSTDRNNGGSGAQGGPPSDARADGQSRSASVQRSGSVGGESVPPADTGSVAEGPTGQVKSLDTAGRGPHEPEYRLSWRRVGLFVGAVAAVVVAYALLRFVFEMSLTGALGELWGLLPFVLDGLVVVL
jgi:hypothetical protein